MKKVIKVPKNIDKDTERYLGALAEMHNENLKGIREGFELMNLKFEKSDTRFNTIDKKLDSHTAMIGVLMEDVSVLKSDVSELKSDMKIVKEDISVIKSDLKKKVDYDEFLSLVKRVQHLESKR